MPCKKTALGAVAVAILAIPFAANASACQDDQRMYDLRPLVEDIGAGKQVEDLMLTGHTYLALNPDLREKLGDHVKVYDDNCEAHAVVDGVPAKKIKVPFGDLFNSYQNAVIQGDQSRVNLLINGFSAGPLPKEFIIQLTSPLIQTPDMLHTLSSPLGLGLHPYMQRHDYCAEEKAPRSLSALDFFVRFDGHVAEDDAAYIFSSTSDGKLTYAAPGTYGEIEYKTDPPRSGTCTILNPNTLATRLSQTGIKMYEVRKVQSHKIDEQYRKAVRGR